MKGTCCEPCAWSLCVQARVARGSRELFACVRGAHLSRDPYYVGIHADPNSDPRDRESSSQFPA